MTAVTVDSDYSDPSAPLTVEDLERMPDDGRRHELLDGMLIVSPAPGARHQKVVAQLVVELTAACPRDLFVFPAPFGVRTAPDTELQPDVLVGRYEDLTERYLPVAPLLAVEVLSPSSALIDVNAKRAAYQRIGVHGYWIIDPLEARLRVFELDDTGEYLQVADIKGEDTFEADHPFPVGITPAGLLGPFFELP
jgi:Uma2 family endonuclease